MMSLDSIIVLGLVVFVFVNEIQSGDYREIANRASDVLNPVIAGMVGCDNDIRLSFACSLEQITKGLDRLEKWLNQ